MSANQTIRRINAQLRYYMHIAEPDALSDQEWAAAFQDLAWIRQEEAKASGI